MAATVGEVLKAGAAALGVGKREFLEELVRFVLPHVGGDSDPGRETLLSYEKASRTRCGYKFAGMVLDFLHSEQKRIRNTQELHLARDACLADLTENRKARYSVPLRTNAASLRRLEIIKGVYIIIRRSPSDETMRCELLILDQQGRKDTQAFATCVYPELVSRGTWCVIQQNVCCTIHGYRGDYARRDIVNLHFLYEDPDEGSRTMMSGFMYGITSRGLRPVVLPAIAIKASRKFSLDDFRTVADGSDAELRACWSMATREKPRVLDKIGKILNAALAPNNGTMVINDGAVVGNVLKSCRGVEEIVDTTIDEFYDNYSEQRSWALRGTLVK